VFDLVAGLPWHVLVVHAVVVVAPIAALGAIVYAASERTRAWLSWPLVVSAAIVLIAAIVANDSGEALQQRVEASAQAGRTTAEELALVTEHVEIGSVTAVVAAAFAIGALLCVLWLLPARRTAVLAGFARGLFPLIVRIAMILVGLAVIVSVVWAGHSGAAAVWMGRLG